MNITRVERTPIEGTPIVHVSHEDAAPVATLCRLCLQHRPLRISHIIPNAYFKAMKRQANGKLIAFSDHPDIPTEMSQDSWSEELLCGDCEGRVSKWETPMIDKLRKAGKMFGTDPDQEIVVPVDYNVLRCFLLSIVWRASVSSLIQYQPVKLDRELQEVLRTGLLKAQAPDSGVLPTVIRKMVDPRGVHSVDAFETFALSPRPFSRHLEGVRFLLGGYMIDFITSKVTNKVRGLVGFIHEKPTLRLKARSFMTIPEFMLASRAVVQKEANGQSKIFR
jgi:hypothetical protein